MMKTDEELLSRLESQDWTEIINRLTLVALNQLKLCGWSTDRDGNAWSPSGTHPEGYALDAMTKVFEGCSTGENKWDPSRGDLFPFLERLVRRLVTDDKKKYSRRKTVSFDELEIEPSHETICSTLNNSLYDRASEKAKELILLLLDQAERDEISWTAIKAELKISEYELNKRRQEIAELLRDEDPFSPK